MATTASTTTTTTTTTTTAAAMATGVFSARVCNAPGCGKPAKMQCPSCLKLARAELVGVSFFCSQDCFKASWVKHKLMHVPVTYDPFPGFVHTGSLRPWPQSPRLTVPAHIQRPDYAETGTPEGELQQRGSNKIEVQGPGDIEKLRTAGRLTREVMDIVAAAVRPGVTTDELNTIVHEAIVARNAYPSPLNYYGYPKALCTSLNEVICHGIPDYRPLQDGDILNLDVSLFHDGVHADLNETFFVGSGVDAAGQKLVNVTRECLQKAIDMIKPGVAYRDLGEVIQAHAHANGFSVVTAFVGHGVHKLYHATPNIPHYAKNKAVGVMKAGHVFTIEPMINEGTYQEKMWPDDWTAVTKDGKRSAQFEQTLLVTETGVEVLTAAHIPGLDSTFSSVHFNARALAGPARMV